MSPTRTRKTAAKNPDSGSNAEREIGLARADDQSGEQAVGAMTNEHDATDGDGLDERIRRRAYELYCSRGERDGGELGDWLEAEHQLHSAHSATEGAAPRVLEPLGDEPASEVRR